MIFGDHSTDVYLGKTYDASPDPGVGGRVLILGDRDTNARPLYVTIEPACYATISLSVYKKGVAITRFVLVTSGHVVPCIEKKKAGKVP